MAADIFGAGLDRRGRRRDRARDSRAGVAQVLSIEHQRALVVRRRGDGGNVLHLERQRARRFEVDGARIRLHQVGDRAADQRIVIAHGDAVAGQDLVAELPGRAVGAVGDEQMVARVHHRQQRRRDRREARRQQGDAGALRSFERQHGRFERFGGRRAAPAVLIARAMGEKILGVRIEHGRGVIDRRIDEAVIGAGLAPGRDQWVSWWRAAAWWSFLLSCHSGASSFQGLLRLPLAGLRSPRHPWRDSGARTRHYPGITRSRQPLDLACRDRSQMRATGPERHRAHAEAWGFAHAVHR